MKQLIAKVKDRSKIDYYKLLSDKIIYDCNISGFQRVNYEPDHDLDEDSWFKVDKFSEQGYCIELLKKEFISAEYNEIPADMFLKIAYLCAVQDDNYFIQKITPSLFATRKILSFGENVKLEEDHRRLFINKEPDAVYIKSEDILIFKNLATISSIFKGIDELYKEATKEEVSEFLEESFIELNDGYGVDRVSKPNRKRVALAMSTLAAMSAPDRSNIFTYINSYCYEKLKFDSENQKFEISSDEELKYLLYGIEQRFYTTMLGQEKRLANSIQSLD